MFRSDHGGLALFMCSMFRRLCPRLVSKGVGHAGHVLKVAELLGRNSYWGNVLKTGAEGSINTIALYHKSSLMNHDCNPNAVQASLIGNKMGIRALRNNIKAGEDITISYAKDVTGTAVSDSYVSKQKDLYATYGFKRRYKRCRRDEELQGSK